MNEILDNELFQAFATASKHVYIYVCDVKNNLSRWSRHAVDYFDMPGEYIENAGSVWLNKIHPNDRARQSKELDRVFSGKSRRYRCEYRAMNRYGDYVWLECRGTMSYDKNNQPRVFAGIMTRLDAKNKYDPLTNLRTIYEFNNYDFTDESGSLLLIDIDRFREIINKYGYSFGDTVLYNFSRKLEELCGDRYIYRLEGDEFVILTPGGDRTDTRELFASIQVMSENLLGPDNQSVHFTVSGGAVLYPDFGNKRDILLGCLEHSLEHAKKSSRGNLVFFSKEIAKRHNNTIQLKHALTQSIQNKFEGFELVYQPLVDAKNHQTTACEALLRWTEPGVGPTNIADVVKMLEVSGEICDVGHFIVDEVFKKAKEWQEEYPGLIVGLNVSYLQFKDPTFVDYLIMKAEENLIDPTYICLELTESSNVDDLATLAGIFKELRSIGFSISLDDFGIAYSTLLLIRSLPVDSVKIDHSFILNLTEDNKVDLAIVESVVSLCRKLNINVVVEGVETKEILDIMSQYPVTLFQGFYFDKPLPVDEFEKKIFKIY